MPAYGLTGPGSLTGGVPDPDPLQDRDSLMRRLGSAHGRERRQIKAALDNLDSMREMQFRERTLAMQQSAHGQQLEQQRAEARQRFEESQAMQQLYHEQLNQSREEAARGREQAQLGEALSNAATLNLPDEVVKAMRDKYIAGTGIGPVTVPADPKAVAEANRQNVERAKKGLPPVPVPQPTQYGGQQQPQTATGTAPTAAQTGAAPVTGAPSGGGGTPLFSGGGGVGSVLRGGGGQPVSPAMMDTSQKIAAGIPVMSGGMVFNQPKGTEGYDFNMGTGEWVPKSSGMGTINGQPSALAVAESALKTGKPPAYASNETYDLYQTGKAAQGVAGAQPTAPSPAVQGFSEGLVKSGFGGGKIEGPTKEMFNQPMSPSALVGEQTAAVPAQSPASTPSGPTGQPIGSTPTANAPQRELTPADYIAHYVGQAGSAIGGGMRDLIARTGTAAPNPPPFMNPNTTPPPGTPGAQALEDKKKQEQQVVLQ